MIPPEKKARHDENEENQDRLSDLPDAVILHILSFLNIKHAVQTCVLSTRWKHKWKHIPTLILHSSRFSTKKHFAKFVSKILTLRDSSTALHTLDVERDGIMEPKLLKKILNYVCSYNTHIQQLRINVTADSCLILNCVSKCRALTSLKLAHPGNRKNYKETLLPTSLNLPLLTSLDLTYFTFYGGESGCAEPFSAFAKLNSLVIRHCTVKDARILSISSETLVDLTMLNNSSDFDKIELSLPSSLSAFTFTGVHVLKIRGNGLSSVKHVTIVAHDYEASVKYPLILLSWLQGLANVESLRVTSTTLQILSLVPDLLVVKLSSLSNLKSLEVELFPVRYEELSRLMEEAMLKKAADKSPKEVAKLRKMFKAGLTPPPIPDGIVDFLRQNSPFAKVNVTTKFPDYFNLKQVEEFVNGTKNTSDHSQFPVSGSGAAPASAAEFASATTPASTAPPNLQLCPAEEDE